MVDDEEDIRNLARIILEDAGYEVIAACDAKEAFDKISAEAPDVVLLDIVMPEISGLEACAEIKAHQKTRRIPVIMFTALGKESDKEKARKMGADGYVVKPFDAEDLLAEVKKQMGASKGGATGGMP